MTDKSRAWKLFSTRRFARRAALASVATAIVGGVASSRGLIAPSADSTGSIAESNSFLAEIALTPEMFGARGDGLTDDSAAFVALAQAAKHKRGVSITFRPAAVYRIGRQDFAGVTGREFAYLGRPMLALTDVRGARIFGNGATMKLTDGLRFGAFDPVSGASLLGREPTINLNKAATIGAMLDIRNCSDVVVEDLLIDGNISAAIIGGEWGDTGIQRAAIGVRIRNSTNIILRGVIARDHGQDGFYVRGKNRADAGGEPDEIRFENCVADGNGRQGMSIVGGRGLEFVDCAFLNTAQGPVSSMPSSGVDIEPNGQDWAVDTRFANCKFENNRGVGLLASTGNSRGLTVEKCTFWQGFSSRDGITQGSGDALWLSREGIQISDCAINGALTHVPSSARIANCTFGNTLHPEFGQSAANRKFLLDNTMGLYTECAFTLAGNAVGGLFYNGGQFNRCMFTIDITSIRRVAYVALVGEDTVLEDCTFIDTGRSGKRMFIKYGGGELRGENVLRGDHLRWGSASGPTGMIPTN